MFNHSKSRFSKFLRRIDKFSVPFQFNIENSRKRKQTEIGGVLTFIVYSLSLAYLIFLLSIYFNDNDPKISSSTLSSTDNNYYDLNDDVLGFGFFIYTENNQTQSIVDYEQEKGNTYLIFKARHHYFDENGIIQEKFIQTKPCSNSSYLKGYLCFDFSSYERQKIKLKYNHQYSGFLFEGLSVYVEKCEGQDGYNCAESKVIDKKLFSLTNLIKVAIKTSRYNTFNNSYDSQYIVDGYGFDSLIGESRQYSLVQSKTTIMSGALFQSKTQNFNIDSFSQTSEVHSGDFMQRLDEPQLQLGTVVSFRLREEIKYIQIQYPQITEILAQSMSLFGVLLLFGKLGYILSEFKLQQGLSNIFLQVYYKRTATAVLNYSKLKDNISKNNNQNVKKQKLKSQSQLSQNPISSKIQISEPQNKEQQNKQENTYSQETEQILQNYRNINETYFPNIFAKIFKMNIFQKLYILFKKKAPSSAFKKNPDYFKQINNVIKKTKKMNSIYDFIKEIIKIKMMVRLLLTKEQYAAIQFCGVDIQNINEFLKNNIQSTPQMNLDLQQPQKVKQKDNEQIQNNQNLSDKNIKKIHLIQNYENNSQSNPYQMSSLQTFIQFEEPDQTTKQTLILKSESDTQPQLTGKSQQLASQTNLKNGEKTQNIILQMQDTNTLIQKEEQSILQNQYINHLEILEGIDNNEHYLSTYLQKFISHVKNNSNELSELDKRIYSCIAQNQHPIKQ